MDLKLWDTKARVLRPMASIHFAGKLGFNMDAFKFMKLDSFPSFVVATKPDDILALEIFLIETESNIGDDISPVTVSKAGLYYYLNIRNMLDQLGIDYKRRMSVYKIAKSDEDYRGHPLYVLSRVRNKPRVRLTKGHEGQDE